MKLLRAIAALLLCLMLQEALARLAPAAARHLDLMMLPVVWYAFARSQRAGMLVGCAAGLLEDAWFHVGVFGLNGFKKTLLGWALGGLASRFELTRSWARFLGGVLASLGDSGLELVLRRLLEEQAPPVRPQELLLRAGIMGLLVAASFLIVERGLRRDRLDAGLARRA